MKDGETDVCLVPCRQGQRLNAIPPKTETELCLRGRRPTIFFERTETKYRVLKDKDQTLCFTGQGPILYLEGRRPNALRPSAKTKRHVPQGQGPSTLPKKNSGRTLCLQEQTLNLLPPRTDTKHHASNFQETIRS